MPSRIPAPLRNAAAFLAAAFAVSLGINSLLPTTPVFGLAQKLDYVATHPEVDTVFVGSSRVFHAFDPRLFDHENAARGLATRSFNLGLDGMRPPESYYVLRQLLRQRSGLRIVFIELADLFPKVNPANLGSARYHHWHDWHHTWLVLRQVARTPGTWPVKLEQAATHLICYVVRLSNLGRGPEIVGAVLRGPTKTPPNPWRENGGFGGQDVPVFSGAAREAFEKAVARLETEALGRVPMPALCAEAVREVVAEVRAAGAQPILVLSPTVARGENFVDLAAAGIDAPLIAFNDPRRYPAIFRAENHCDAEHLNTTGAAACTRALAEEFATLARESSIEPRRASGNLP